MAASRRCLAWLKPVRSSPTRCRLMRVISDRSRGMRRRPKSRSWAQLSSGTSSTSRRIAIRSICTCRNIQVLAKWHIDFLDQDENGIPDDTNGDGLISYGTGSSPDYSVADIWIGDEVDLRPEETGWQDTVVVDPHQMMAIVATFDKAGDYVWHCHILSHEDNEMMRPYTSQSAIST